MNNERTIKYIGEGAYLPGVPARDLTPDEYAMHAEAINACPQKLYIVPAETDNAPAESSLRGKTK
jgi:hypothetical protein